MMNSSQSIISNVVWKFAERFLAQIVSLVVSVVLARILLPKDYGAISMVMVFITIANVFVSEGIPSALIQKKDADQLDFSSVFHFNIWVSLILYLIIFLLAPFVADFYNDEVLCPVLRVLGVRLIVAAINSVQHAYVSRHMMFRKYFWSTLFGTLLSGVIGIWMAYQGFGVWALVAQYMINTTVDTMVLFITVEWKPKLIYNFERVRSLLRFGWKMLFEGVANAISGQIRNLIIGKVYSSADLAYYTKGQQFPSLIVTNISTSIGAVLFPAMADEQNNKDRVLLMLRKSVKVSSYIVYPMLVGLAAVATPFISLALTDKWIETVPYLQAFCLLNMPTVGMIPRHQALNGTGRSDIFMYEHIAARIISFILLFLTYRISVIAIVMSSFICSAVLCLIIAYTSKKYNGYSYRDQVKDILPICGACFVMAIPVYFIQFIGLHSLITILLQVLTGTVIYISFSKVMHLEEYKICKQYLLMVIGKFRRSKA